MSDGELELLAARYAGGDRSCEDALGQRIFQFAREWAGARLNRPQFRADVDGLANERPRNVSTGLRQLRYEISVAW